MKEEERKMREEGKDESDIYCAGICFDTALGATCSAVSLKGMITVFTFQLTSCQDSLLTAVFLHRFPVSARVTHSGYGSPPCESKSVAITSTFETNRLHCIL